ncbi:MAG: winged helix-turn-helix transcriptional regulator [Candidatus Diapherotrites archaeon]
MIDELDKKILQTLEDDPDTTKTNYQKIADTFGLTRQAITYRIFKLKQKGVLEGFEPKINLTELGYTTTFLILTKAKPGKLEAAAIKWAKDDNVCSLHRMAGEYDLAIVVKFHDEKEVDTWNQKISGDEELIERTNSLYVFSTKKQGANPNKLKVK